MLRRTLIPALALAAAAAPLHAQSAAGRADLRYVAEAPLRLTYATHEKGETDGRPQPEIRSTLDVELAPAGDGAGGVDVRVVTRERTSTSGRARVPAPVELRISPRGELLTEGDDLGNHDPTLGEGPILLWPGRVLGLQESWSDSIVSTRADGPLAMTAHVRVHATYERDTVVAGRVLNVIRYTSDDVVTGRGEMFGNTIEVSVKSRREEVVLWDSERHLVVHREARRTAENASPDMPFAMLRATMVWTLVEDPADA